MNAEKWASVCLKISQFYSICAPLCVDPSERIARAERCEDAIRQIKKGISAEMVRIPGIGTGGLPTYGQAAARANSR